MKMKKSEKRFLVKLASVLMGIILWVIIVYIEDASFDTGLKGIPISVSGENVLIGQDLVVVNKGEIGQASISVRGKRSDIINASDGIYAVADVSKISAPGTYNIKVNYELASNTLYITDRKTQYVEIEVEKAVVKEFPLELVHRGTLPDSTKIVESNAKKKKITVSGSEKDIEKIGHMAVFVDISKMTGEITDNYKVSAADGELKEIKFTNSIYPSYESVDVSSVLHKKVSLPVNVEFNSKDLEKYALEIESVSAKEIDVGVAEGVEISALRAIVDYDENTRATEYTVELEGQEGVYIPTQDREITVKLKVRPVVERYIAVPLNVKSTAGGSYSAPQTVNLLVRGAAEDMLQENISAQADITGYSRGTHTVEIKVNFSKGSLSMKNKQYVEITIG